MTRKLVLDTNVILDWLLFADPRLNSLTKAVGSAKVQLLTHQPALNELSRVLGYEVFKLDASRREIIFNEYRHHAYDCSLPSGFTLTNLLLPDGFPRCKDPDDQHFLAVTYHARADALVTRDKALLALKKSARKFDTVIMDVRLLPDFLTTD